jgi:hypothetical protein
MKIVKSKLVIIYYKVYELFKFIRVSEKIIKINHMIC